MTERLYLFDSLKVLFEAHVADVRQAVQTREGGLWQVSLDRTAFYPFGGGQPCDLGVLLATSPGGAVLRAPVTAVEEDEAGEIWHTTEKPLLAGTLVRGEVDFARRLDHMQQHSGQHLLSAVFWRVLHAATVSFHLGAAEATIDLAIDSVTREQLRHVEDESNRAIAENRPVKLRAVSRSDAEALLAAGALRKLPPREGEIRLVEIESLDLNACGGTHVRSTGEIGGVAIRCVERMHHHLRVTFVCGLRAMRAARVDWETLDRVSKLLSVEREQTPAAVERLVAEQKTASKERQKLRQGLAEATALRLLSGGVEGSAFRIVRQAMNDADGEYLTLVARKMTTVDPGVAVLIASNAAEPAKVVLGVGAKVGADCGAILKACLAARGGRGGGARGMAQGEIPRAHLEGALAEIEDNLRTMAPAG